MPWEWLGIRKPHALLRRHFMRWTIAHAHAVAELEQDRAQPAGKAAGLIANDKFVGVD